MLTRLFEAGTAGKEVDAQGDPVELDAAGSGNFHNALDSEGFNACSLYGMRKRGFTQIATVRPSLLGQPCDVQYPKLRNIREYQEPVVTFSAAEQPPRFDPMGDTWHSYELP